MDTFERIFLMVILAVSVAVIGLQVPAIQTVRDEKYDATTASDLGELRRSVAQYVTKNDELPASLASVGSSIEIERDVSTYKYAKKSSSKYELCATFRTSTVKTNSEDNRAVSELVSYADFKTHPKGEHCFELEEMIYPSYESSSNDWLDSYCEDAPSAALCT